MSEVEITNESFSAHQPNATHGVVGNLAELQRMLAAPVLAQQYRPIAVSEEMTSVIDRSQRFAQSSATVMLTGESGTGKEVVARWIHQCSRRVDRPYVRVNCAALPESLIESELFGHERGAFTGATQQRQGRIATAEDGTILLDEISEIPLGLQAKLLRVLEEEEYQRVGGDECQQVRARVIATSNRQLEEEVRCGRFREDLYYRLNVLRISLPSLRERPSDIPLLADCFLQQFKHESIYDLQGFTTDTIDRLQRSTWPGNIRQLSNVVQRACVTTEGDRLTPEDVGTLDETPPATNAGEPNLDVLSLEELEKHFLLRALTRHHGNKTAAARDLGITTRTLSNKLVRYQSGKEFQLRVA